MKKKLLLLSLLVLTMAMGAQAASLRGISLEITDEYWKPVTDITSITVYDAGTTTASTIYSDRAGTLAMVNPITTVSTNTTFSQSLGQVRWFQRAPDYKVTITDGTKTLTIDNRTGSKTRFPWFENYIGTAASLSVDDNQEIVVGTDSDAVLSWVNASDILNWIPAADGVAFNIGSTSVAKQFDFNVYVGGIAGGGLAINEGASPPTFGWTGGVFNVNASSDFATNINTGTSTGAVSIGNSAGGAWSIDGAGTGTVNSDGAMTITATAGTIGIASTGGDTTIDATDKSVIIRGTESVADAVLIDADGAAGGVHIDSGTGDITLDSGDDIFLEADTGVGDVISIINTKGTDTGAVILRAVAAGGDVNIESKAGRVLIEGEEDVAEAVLITADGGTITTLKIHNDTGDSATSVYILSDVGGITATATAGPIVLNAGGGATGDYTATIGDEYILDVAGGISVDSAEAAQDAIGLVASAGGGGITLTAGTLGVTISGDILKNYVKEIEVEAGTSETVLAADSSKVFVTTVGVGTTTYTLPTAAAGLHFTFIKNSVAASDGVKITANTGDTIDTGAPAQSYSTVDATVPAAVTIIAVDAGSWQIISSEASWVNDAN